MRLHHSSLILFVALACSSAGRAVTPHPTVLLVEQGGQRSPVVKVTGTDPVIVRDDKEKRIRTQATYFAARAPHFGEGEVRIALKGSGISYHLTINALDEPSPTAPVAAGGYDFEARLTPSVDLNGAFIAVLLVDDAFLKGTTDNPGVEIVVNALPDLPANRESTVKFGSPISRQGKRTGLPLVFAQGGVEVRNSMWEASARYFERVERIVLGDAVARYRAQFPTGDRPAAPLLTFQPIIPAGIRLPTEPVITQVTVGEDGLVRDVTLPPTLEPALGDALHETLSGWQFLPRLKAGQPVPVKIQVPMKF